MTATTATPLETLAQKIARHQAELEALRREYESRQTSLADLNRQKEALRTQLRQVEADIQAASQGSLSGQALAPQHPRQHKPKAHTPKASPANTTPSQPTSFRQNSLPALLLDILDKASSPLTVKQLATEMVRRKYPTTSSNLPAIIETRAGDLIRKGLLRRASGQPGLVATAFAAKSPGGKAPPAAKTSPRNGAVVVKKAPPAKSNGQKQQPPLRVIITNMLAKNRRPMTGRELAEQVLASGYQTKSKNFIDVMSVALAQMDSIRNLPGKGYTLTK